MPVSFLHEGFVEETARHAGLVRHQHQRISCLPQQPQGDCGIGEQRDGLELVEISTLFDDRAVAIEEHGWSHVCSPRDRRHRPMLRSVAPTTVSTSMLVMQR